MENPTISAQPKYTKSGIVPSGTYEPSVTICATLFGLPLRTMMKRRPVGMRLWKRRGRGRSVARTIF